MNVEDLNPIRYQVNRRKINESDSRKQRGFKGIEGVNLTTEKGDSQKNAITRSRAVISAKGLMVGQTWKVWVVDSMNLAVSRRQVSKKSGKERWTIEGYFGTIAGCLHFIAERGVKETELRDLQMVVDRVEELKRDISLALKGIEVEC